MLSKKVVTLMNIFVVWFRFFDYRVPMLHTRLIVWKETLLRCYSRLKSIYLNDVLAQPKHCPRLCLSCFQLLQMVSSNI